MERRTIVIPVRVDLICDECGEVMKSTGETYMIYPPKFPHRCKNGHKVVVAKKQYPSIEYVEATQYIHTKKEEL